MKNRFQIAKNEYIDRQLSKIDVHDLDETSILMHNTADWAYGYFMLHIVAGHAYKQLEDETNALSKSLDELYEENCELKIRISKLEKAIVDTLEEEKFANPSFEELKRALK